MTPAPPLVAGPYTTPRVRVGQLLTPELRAELQGSFAR